MRYLTPGKWLAYLFLLIPTSTSFALASNQYASSILSLKRRLGKVSNGEANTFLRRESRGGEGATSSSLPAIKESLIEISGGAMAVSAAPPKSQF
jgi:hypothetical protein